MVTDTPLGKLCRPRSYASGPDATDQQETRCAVSSARAIHGLPRRWPMSRRPLPPACSASRKEIAGHATDQSGNQQSEERLLHNSAGDGCPCVSRLVSDVAIRVLRRHGCLAYHFPHLGLGTIGKVSGGSLYLACEVSGVFMKVGIHRSYSCWLRCWNTRLIWNCASVRFVRL